MLGTSLEKSLLLSLAIIDLCIPGFAYYYPLLFSQTFFSPVIGVIGLILIALSIGMLIIIYNLPKERVRVYNVIFAVASLLAVAYILHLLPTFVIYLGISSNLYRIVLTVAAIVVVVAILMILKALFGAWSHSKIGKARWAAAIILLFLAIFAANYVMYKLPNAQTPGNDEMAFNYYAAYLFLHGQNPYSASMMPALNAMKVIPTFSMGGGIESKYLYPPLSFLIFTFMPLLGVSSFIIFLELIVAVAIIAAFAVFYKSRFENKMLIPIAVWLFIVFYFGGSTISYVSASLFLLFAYISKEKPLASGIFIGLAAATSQISWLMLPFFYIYLAKTQRKAQAAKNLLAALLVFIILNAYFIFTSTAALGSIVGILGYSTSKLVPQGISIMQILIPFYPVALWYVAASMLVMLSLMLLLFYLYPKELKPMLFISPIVLFIFSLKSAFVYYTIFMPILLLIMYEGEKEEFSPATRNRKILAYFASIVAVLLLLLLAVYAHAAYASNKLLIINSVKPALIQQSSIYGNYTKLNAISVNVTNRFAKNETILFYIISNFPSNIEYEVASKTLQPNETHTYWLTFQLPEVNYYTKIMVFAMSNNYVASNVIALSKLPR